MGENRTRKRRLGVRRGGMRSPDKCEAQRSEAEHHSASSQCRKSERARGGIRRSIADGDLPPKLCASPVDEPARRCEALIRHHKSDATTFGKFWIAELGEIRVAEFAPRSSSKCSTSSRSNAHDEDDRSLHGIPSQKLNLEVNSLHLHWNPFKDPRVNSRPTSDSLSLGNGEARLRSKLTERDRARVGFAILTGLRESEQEALKWKDVKFKGLLTLNDQKNKTLRRYVRSIYPLTPEAIEILTGLDKLADIRSTSSQRGPGLTMTPAEREGGGDSRVPLETLPHANPVADVPIVEAIIAIQTAEPEIGYGTVEIGSRRGSLKVNDDASAGLGRRSPRPAGPIIRAPTSYAGRRAARLGCWRDWLYSVTRTIRSWSGAPMRRGSFYRNVCVGTARR